MTLKFTKMFFTLGLALALLTPLASTGAQTEQVDAPARQQFNPGDEFAKPSR